METNKQPLSNLLHSIIESKKIYLDVFDKTNNELVMKLSLDVDDESLIYVLDNLFDNGFYVKKIDRSNYDSFETDRFFNFNL
jgi:hypothetical protein